MPKQPGIVLAAADLSRDPDPAIVSGTRLSALTGSALHVVHCVAAGSSDEDVDAAGESLQQQAPPGTPVTVVVGTPHEEISAHAAALPADVVVLGPRRNRSAVAGLLGGTAHRILRATRVPCLLANAELPADPARILLAMDWSDPGRSAFQSCVDLVVAFTDNPSRSTRLHVHLLTISAFAHPAHGALSASSLAPFAGELSGAVDADAVVVTHEVYSAPLAVEGILARAETFHPDLLIMGTRGSGLTVRVLLGSVANDIARSATVPLLLVPPRTEAALPGEGKQRETISKAP